MKKIVNILFASGFFLFLFALILSLVTYKFSGNKYLSFSDSAKFADVARSISTGEGYYSNFKFFSWLSLSDLKNDISDASGILPLYPLVLSVFFRFAGVSDFVVMTCSAIFFGFTVWITYHLALKMFGKTVGIFSALAVAVDKSMLYYSTSGASETLFIFLILLTLYFFGNESRHGRYLGFLGLIFLYFTKFQSLIYIFPLIIFYCLNKFEIKKALVVFLGMVILLFTLDKIYFSFVKTPLFLYSISTQTKSAVLNYTSGSGSASGFLRGVQTSLDLTEVFKKVFYNLYNFYKLLPDILNPYIFSFFLVGLFVFKGGGRTFIFKLTAFFMVSLTFLVAASSIPFFRYIHPIIPLVYIIGVATLNDFVSLINFPLGGKFIKQNKPTQDLYRLFLLSILLAYFALGQTVGSIFLDTRFAKGVYNFDKPPVYVQLSNVLKEKLKKDDIVITNLDTWGSWYGKTKTVWYPYYPKMLIDRQTNTIPFDAIYLTSYKMNDENYYMAEEWRQIFNNPDDKSKWTCEGCDIIAKEFEIKGKYLFEGNSNYENEVARSLLLVRK